MPHADVIVVGSANVDTTVYSHSPGHGVQDQAGVGERCDAARCPSTDGTSGVVGGYVSEAAYNATKGAVVNLTRQLAAQWGGRGVRVNALAPGYFPSEMTGCLADPDFAQSIRERTLLARTPDLHEIDGPLLFLATDASSYVTGHVLVVDGGWTAV